MMPFCIVLALVVLPAPIAVLAALYFNAKTFQIVVGIQREYRQKGMEWDFWTHRERLIAFVLNPTTLLTESPALARGRKTLLIRHRYRLRIYLMHVFVFVLTSFTLGMVLLLLMASMS